jgi:hypothetical protein
LYSSFNAGNITFSIQDLNEEFPEVVPNITSIPSLGISLNVSPLELNTIAGEVT